MGNNLEFSGEEYITFVKEIISQTGPRLPTSESERKGALILKDKIETQFSRDVVVDEFICAPKASIASIPLLGWIMLFIGLPGYYISPILSLIVFIFVFVFFILQILRYKGTLDFLFPKGKSQNIYAKLNSLPEGEKPKFNLIFSAHIDSSWTWKLALKNPTKMWLKVPYGIIGGLVLLLLSFLRILSDQDFIPNLGSWVIYVPILFVPGFIYISNYLSWNPKVASPGAMDNMSGIAQIFFLGKFYQLHPEKIPEGAQLILIAFGSEEASLKGSKAFVKKHQSDMLSIPTIVLNFDGIRDFDHFHVVDGDIFLGARYDEKLCALAHQVMKEHGVTNERMKNPVGGTDGASFSFVDIPVVTLIAQTPDASEYYHTYNDIPEDLNPKTFEKMHQIAIDLVDRIPTLL